MKISVRGLKAGVITSIICAVICFIISIIIFSSASEYADSAYYYWSSEIRIWVVILAFAGFGVIMSGVFCLIWGIVLWILQKNGKVCPKCERVLFSSVIVCPSCNTDVTRAMKVSEHLSNHPTIASKPFIPHPPAPTENSEAKNTEAKRFCTHCGHEITQNAEFCSNCGSKIK